MASSRALLAVVALAASASAISIPPHRSPALAMAGAGGLDLQKPPRFLSGAYTAAGVATTATWANIVRTTIRSNQPVGAMMPSWQHGVCGRTSVLSAVPVIISAYSVLASAAHKSWESLSSETCRRLNLALATAGTGGALWVALAPLITRIPDSGLSHQSYTGAPRALMIGAYASAAALSAAVWARSLPEDARKNPLSWPGRVADGVCRSLVSLGPKDSDSPTNVKYSVLASSFLILTALQLGSFPTAVVPSWTGRRLSRHFPAWTLLAAASSITLKEATEEGRLMADGACRALSRGITGMGAVYLTAKFGSVFLDPSWPGHYKLVCAAPAWQAAASLMFAMTLRPDAGKEANKVQAPTDGGKAGTQVQAGRAVAALLGGAALAALQK